MANLQTIGTPYVWPYPIVTRIHEPGQKPTRERVLQCLLEINTNAVSVITSTLGAPGFGLLGLTTTGAEYLMLTGLAWHRPAQPAAAPTVAHDATQFIIAEANRVWTGEWIQYNMMLQVDTVLRNQLLAAADDMYYCSLFQPVVGYGRRTALDLLTHLQTHYAEFDEATKATVQTQMAAPWSGGPF